MHIYLSLECMWHLSGTTTSKFFSLFLCFIVLLLFHFIGLLWFGLFFWWWYWCWFFKVAQYFQGLQNHLCTASLSEFANVLLDFNETSQAWGVEFGAPREQAYFLPTQGHIAWRLKWGCGAKRFIAPLTHIATCPQTQFFSLIAHHTELPG